MSSHFPGLTEQPRTGDDGLRLMAASDNETGGEPLHRRKVRSYARRQSRMSDIHRHALLTRWPQYGVEPSAAEQLNSAALFGRNAPLYIEIGFGNGDTLLHLAQHQPEHNFLGIEVHRPGLGRVVYELGERNLSNVRVVCADAVEILRDHIADNTLAGVYIFFPDPWPKRKHHKRRIINSEFARLLAAKLAPGGIMHMATDWEHYAHHALAVLNSCAALTNANVEASFAARPSYRPLTKFELRGKTLGHPIRDLIFLKAMQTTA